jgi:hypothetical protein
MGQIYILAIVLLTLTSLMMAMAEKLTTVTNPCTPYSVFSIRHAPLLVTWTNPLEPWYLKHWQMILLKVHQQITLKMVEVKAFLVTNYVNFATHVCSV